MEIRAIKNRILISYIESGEQVTNAGLVLLDDNGKERGIRSRWGLVYAVGPTIVDIKPGNWILISHGRWSRKFGTITKDGVDLDLRSVDPEGVLLVSAEKPDLNLRN